MDHEMEEELLEIFSSFTAGASEMDGRTFVKCMKASSLLDQRNMKTSDADLIFVRHKMQGLRKINFLEFVHCLAEVAEKKGISEEDVAELVTGASLPMSNVTSSASCQSSGMVSLPSGASCSGTGPERLFYDKSTYTGTHRNGGPKVIGGTDVISSKELMNRDSRKGPLPVLLGGAEPAPRGDKVLATMSTRSTMAGTSSTRSNDRMSGMTSLRSSDRMSGMTSLRSSDRMTERPSTQAQRRGKSPTAGPERFFYDKSTYTGTHRRGGPSSVGNGLPKQNGYEDLSQLVNRSATQDDALHRRKRLAGGL